MDERNKISIVYRIYPKVSKKPIVHSKDKFALSRLCLKSFANALRDVDYRMKVIFDSCPSEYERMFDELFPKERTEYVRLSGAGNAKTFKMQIDSLLEQDFSDLIYFAEDDYFYLPDSIEKGIEFFQTGKADFLSLFDHLDYYTSPFHEYKSKIFTGAGVHWRESQATCLTFLTDKRRLKATESAFMTYARRNFDTSLWMTITKKKIFDPRLYFCVAPKNIINFKIVSKAYFFGAFRIFFGKKYRLVTPMPGLALHMESETVSPNVNWLDEFNKIEPGTSEK